MRSDEARRVKEEVARVMSVREFFEVRDVKLAAVVAALLFALGIFFMAQPAGAATCLDCPPGDGGGDTNSPPTVGVDVASMTVNEGERVTNAGTFSDPDGNSTVALSASVGTVTKNDADGSWNWDFRATDGPDESQTVTITATDGTDTSTTTFSLTVNNLSPVIYWQSFNSLQPPEDTVRRYEFGVYDPGNDTFTVHDRWCGNGVRVSWDSHDNDSTAFHYVECRFPDGPGSTIVTAKATDSDGATSNTGNLTVDIVNVNPTAILDAPVSVDKGDTATISLTNQNDVQADKNAGFRYAFACDGGSLDGAAYANSGIAALTDCTFDDNGTKTVRARIIDKDGGFNEYTKGITVNNVAPTATLNDPASADQGNNFTISLTDASDPSSADEASLTYAFDCGDGSGYDAAGSAASKSCIAPDQPSVRVKAKVIDKDGGETEYTANVAVNNVAPTGTVKINGGAAYTKSPSVKLSLPATDSGSGIASMRLKNDGGTWSGWEPYATSKNWTLNNANGTRTVYVQYKDKAGNVSNIVRDTIKLDTIKPKVSSMSPKHQSIIKDTTPTIKAIVKDNLTNLQKSNIKLYVNGSLISATKYSYDRSTDQLVYNSPKVGKGKKTIKIVATDAAKNVGSKSWYFTIK
jgi:hypothetical protein